MTRITRNGVTAMKNPRSFTQGADGKFYLTFFGKRFGKTEYATELEARSAAILWDQASIAADRQESPFA